MRVSREQATINRELVLHHAVDMFKRLGVDGVSIADVMKCAELTHGGFYKQFASKEALTREACAKGLQSSVDVLDKAAAGTDSQSLARVLSSYLSTAHRDRAGSDCALASLAVDAGRGPVALQEVFAQGIIGMAGALDRIAARDSSLSQDHRERPDFSLLSSLVGAIILSRAVAAAEPALADHILADTLKHLITQPTDAHRSTLPPEL